MCFVCKITYANLSLLEFSLIAISLLQDFLPDLPRSLMIFSKFLLYYQLLGFGFPVCSQRGFLAYSNRCSISRFVAF